MPLYKSWERGPNRYALWKIEEPEDFFLQHTGLSSDKKHAVRRLEHLAGRFLLQQLLPGFPLGQIRVSPLGKPYLPGSNLHFSLSHSYPYVSAALSTGETGIDVQTFQEKILRLQHKFLSPQEQELCSGDILKITLAWTAKEAAFKRYGLGGVDFIRHMPITLLQLQQSEAHISLQFSTAAIPVTLSLHGGWDEDCAWSAI